MKITLLTGGGGDIYYEIGLVSGLVKHQIFIDFIGGDDALRHNIFQISPNAKYINLRGDQSENKPTAGKIFRIIKYYYLLMKYAYETDSKIFHIQWLNKFELIDRTILNKYYKLLGKKLVYTAHNVDSHVRDGKSSLLNKMSLKYMYNIMDMVIVHTYDMKRQIVEDFQVKENKVMVIDYGINNMVYKSDITKSKAREKLSIDEKDKIILFFGHIAPYKGLEILISALKMLRDKQENIKLIIAGRIKKGCEEYWKYIKSEIGNKNLEEFIFLSIEFIKNEDIELYFKASDVLILPYRHIFQSGILFLSYNFGLPVIAADIGSMKEFIKESATGYVFKPEDPKDLSDTIIKYFNGEMYCKLEEHRERIYNYAIEKYSWDKIGIKTYAIYEKISGNDKTKSQ